MKSAKLFFIVFFLFQLASSLQSQTIYVSGPIVSNTTWAADTVKITGDINVGQGVVLSVEPGTYVEVQGYFRIYVSGSVRAIGTSTDSIVFTARHTAGFWDDTLSVAGGWAGFNIMSTYASADSSVFEFCKIQYGKRYGEYGDDIKGGALFVSDYGTLIIRNCFVNSNMVICYEGGIDGCAGGAVYCKKVNIVTIVNNRFERNRSFDNGGAIHADIMCQTLIDNNIFQYNRSIEWERIGSLFVISGSGAAIATSDDPGYSPVISNNRFFGNTCIGGIIYTSNRNCLIFNNLVCNNYGSGIMDGHQLSMSRIFNNTVVNNETYSGGMNISSYARIYNNIVWGNEPYPRAITEQIHTFPGFSSPSLFYNCVQYGNGGPNSTSEYPEFAHPSDGAGLAYSGAEADWTLGDYTPCINRGTLDTAGLFIPAFDLVGNTRIYGVRIDMGCYENQSVLTGITDAIGADEKASVYPNPGSNQLNIRSQEPQAYFELSNMTGQLMIQQRIAEGTSSLDTESLKPGIYFYRLRNDQNAVIGSGKWVKN
ncbi:MAG: T9SS type A sorting domain-containing protein [Bacteroidota bacterium]